jgi:hypothetical protein
MGSVKRDAPSLATRERYCAGGDFLSRVEYEKNASDGWQPEYVCARGASHGPTLAQGRHNNMCARGASEHCV